MYFIKLSRAHNRNHQKINGMKTVVLVIASCLFTYSAFSQNPGFLGSKNFVQISAVPQGDFVGPKGLFFEAWSKRYFLGSEVSLGRSINRGLSLSVHYHSANPLMGYERRIPPASFGADPTFESHTMKLNMREYGVRLNFHNLKRQNAIAPVGSYWGTELMFATAKPKSIVSEPSANISEFQDLTMNQLAMKLHGGRRLALSPHFAVDFGMFMKLSLKGFNGILDAHNNRDNGKSYYSYFIKSSSGWDNADNRDKLRSRMLIHNWMGYRIGLSYIF